MFSSAPSSLKLGHYNLLPSILSLLFINCLEFIFLGNYWPSDAHRNTVDLGLHVHLPRMQHTTPSFWLSQIRLLIEMLAKFQWVLICWCLYIFTSAHLLSFQYRQFFVKCSLPARIMIANAGACKGKRSASMFTKTTQYLCYLFLTF